MANLRVDKITSTETFETTGSVQFTNNGGSLTVPDSAIFDIGTDDFTIECFAYINTLGQFNNIFAVGEDTQDGYRLDISTSDILRFIGDIGGSWGVVITGDTTLSSSTWYHLAVTRNGNKFDLWVNGVRDTGTVTNAGTITNPTTQLEIGRLTNNSLDRNYSGYISNLRFINGKAIYTANFKPPMKELEVTPETVILACQSKTDASLEKTGQTITVVGVSSAIASELTPGILTPVPKAGAGSAITGSVEFDGNDDYLSVSDSSDWDVGTSAFTLECFINMSSSSVDFSGIFGMHTGSTQFQFRINNQGRIQFLQDFGGTRGNTDDSDTTGTNIRDGAWHHVALTRQSDNSWQLYVDGLVNYSGTGMTGDVTGINEVAIGRRADNDSNYLNGFISN
ncbi:MAG: LamG domain-containing protein, partial [Rhodospirillaceae bacterium]